MKRIEDLTQFKIFNQTVSVIIEPIPLNAELQINIYKAFFNRYKYKDIFKIK